MKRPLLLSISALACLLICVGCGGPFFDDTQDPSDPSATEDLYQQLVPPPYYGTPLADLECAPNEILYCTKYDYPIEPNITQGFTGKLQANTYENGVGRLIFDNDVTIIPKSAFAGCNSLTYIKFPNTLETIDDKAFDGCTSLISFSLPQKTKKFGYDNVLRGCTSFEVLYMNTEKLVVPDNIRIEGNNAFVVCVPEALLADCINRNAKNSAPISFPFAAYDFEQNKLLSDYVLLYKTDNCEPMQLYVWKGEYDNINDLGQVLGANICKSSGLGALIFGYPLTTIGSFYSTELTDYDASHITYIKIPSSTKEIGNYAFDHLGVEEIDVPDSVEKVGEGAFESCKNLKTLTLGRGLGSRTYRIGVGICDWCTSLEKVYCKATTPPWAHEWGLFSGYTDSFTIYVPKESLDAYLADKYWGKWSERLVGYKF